MPNTTKRDLMYQAKTCVECSKEFAPRSGVQQRCDACRRPQKTKKGPSPETLIAIRAEIAAAMKEGGQRQAKLSERAEKVAELEKKYVPDKSQYDKLLRKLAHCDYDGSTEEAQAFIDRRRFLIGKQIRESLYRGIGGEATEALWDDFRFVVGIVLPHDSVAWAENALNT